MEGIKNLIIDFGGVIINLTRNRCVEAFESFGVPDVRDCILNSKDLFMQIEMGTITSAEFRDGIRHLSPAAPDRRTDRCCLDCHAR